MQVSHTNFFKRLPLVLLSSSVYSPWSENTKGGQRASRVGPSHWHLLPHQNWRERNKAHWRTKGHPEDPVPWRSPNTKQTRPVTHLRSWRHNPQASTALFSFSLSLSPALVMAGTDRAEPAEPMALPPVFPAMPLFNSKSSCLTSL